VSSSLQTLITPIIENAHQAKLETGKSFKILMDLGGPKLRTGPIAPGPKVIKVQPHRNISGMYDLVYGLIMGQVM
jgi:pyruvate kinase